MATQQFQTWMQNTFTNAANPQVYQVHPGTQSHIYNCFAYAIGCTTRRITPATKAALDVECKVDPLVHLWQQLSNSPMQMLVSGFSKFLTTRFKTEMLR